MSRRLFEQPEENTPDTSLRLAFGKALANTKNMTLANFKSWLLNSDISFLRQSNDLSEVNASIARSNLEVPKSSEVYDQLDLRVKALDGGSNAECLSITNEWTSYQPTAPGHPVPKSYSDLKGGNILMRGEANIGNPNPSNGLVFDISFASVETVSYIVSGCFIDDNGYAQDIMYGISNRTATSFRITFREEIVHVRTLKFPFVLIALTGSVTVTVTQPA